MKARCLKTLQQIPYGDLENGDEYTLALGHPPNKKGDYLMLSDNQIVIALDHIKYPPTEVTWVIEGIDDERMIKHDGVVVLRPSQMIFKEYETIFV